MTAMVQQSGLLAAQSPGSATPPHGALREMLRANVVADFAFYRRSRLLMAFGLAFLLLTGLSCLPQLFSDSGIDKFNTLRQVISQLNVFLLILSGGLSLFIVSSHLRNRSLKMVFTKPCSPAVWLLSVMLSAAAVSFLLNLVVLGSGLFLSLVWRVPVRAGLMFLAIDTFTVSLIVIAYMILLATVAHPAIAVTFVAIFNADLFYQFQTWTSAAIRSGKTHLGLRILERIFHFVYLVLPMYGAFGKQTGSVESSLRVEHGQWKYLVHSFGYALVFSIFCYLLALLTLQNKRHT